MRKIINDIKRMHKLDTSDMHDALYYFPDTMRDAERIGSNFKLPEKFKRNYNSIVFSGLGGSAIGADFIRSYLEEEVETPIIVNRDYTIPGIVNENTLFIVSSYSGNTEETLSAYEFAKKKKANIMSLSSNGKLMDLSVKSDIPFMRIPGRLAPRAALAYGTIPFLCVFAKLGIIRWKSSEIKEAVRLLSNLRGKLRLEVPARKNLAKKIASRIYGKIPIIYGADRYIDVVVTRWRGQLAENSKTLSFGHVLPEMNHNEIVGWQNPKKLLKSLIVLLLRDSGDHPRVAKRMEITKDIIKKMGTKVIEVNSTGKGLLARMFSLVCIGDWVSFYLAALNGVDPTPVKRITYLKKKLIQ